MIRRRTENQNIKEYRCDVAVIGGGVAGVMAAAAAGKCGARTLLVESDSCVGGVVTMGPLEALMTQYDSDHKIIGGLVQELLDSLYRFSSPQAVTVNDTTGYCRKIVPYNPEYLKMQLMELVFRYHVEVLLNTTLTDVTMTKGRITSVLLQTKNAPIRVYAKAFIDCTGSGFLGYMAGCDVFSGDDAGCHQPVTVLSRWGNVDGKKLRDYVRENPQSFKTFDTEIDLNAQYLHLWGFSDALKDGYQSGALQLKREEMHLMECVVPGEVIVNFSRINADPFDAFAMSRAQEEGIRQTVELFEYFRSRIEAFHYAEIIQIGSVGIRESGRVCGRYVLDRDDVIKGEKCKEDDCVAYGAFPIDIHQLGSGMHFERVLRGYRIPADALRAEQISNLFMGGRCISSTFEANASCRISMTCMATGQAAGVMAYENAVYGDEQLTKRTRETLRKLNAIL